MVFPLTSIGCTTCYWLVLSMVIVLFPLHVTKAAEICYADISTKGVTRISHKICDRQKILRGQTLKPGTEP